MLNGAYFIIIFSFISFMVNFKKNLYIYQNLRLKLKSFAVIFRIVRSQLNLPSNISVNLGNNRTTSLFGAGNGVWISEIKLIGTNVAHFCIFLYVFFFSGGTVVQGRPSDFFRPRTTDLQLF